MRGTSRGTSSRSLRTMRASYCARAGSGAVLDRAAVRLGLRGGHLLAAEDGVEGVADVVDQLVAVGLAERSVVERAHVHERPFAVDDVHVRRGLGRVGLAG